MSEEELENENVEEIDNNSVLSQDEIDAILAEYKHQQMLEQMVGPLTSMIVHVAGILLVVIMISTGGKPQESKTIVEMMPPEKPVEVEDPPDIEPPEPEPIEVEVPEIDIAPPSDNTAGAPEGDVIEPAGEQFSIPPSNSPFRLKIPAGNSRGSFGFGKAGVGNGGGRGGTGGGGNPAMNGRLYDLKKTKAQQAIQIGNYEDYFERISPELWRYFQTPVKSRPNITNAANPFSKYYCALDETGKIKTLMSSCVFIRDMDANAAPEAYKVEKVVQPRAWLAHYQASLVVARDMEVRFWGQGDDFLGIFLDAQPVLVAGFYANYRKYGFASWQVTDRRPGGYIINTGDGGLSAGKWVSLKKGQKVHIDVVFSEIPGGRFGVGILLEKKGMTYRKNAKGENILPVFSTTEFAPGFLQELEARVAKGRSGNQSVIDAKVESDLLEFYKKGIHDFEGGMITRTTADFFNDKIEAQKLDFE